MAYSEGGLMVYLSVVIPVKDGAKTIEEQLKSLSVQDVKFDWELIIADNGSTDGLLDVVTPWQSRIPNLKVVDASRAPGINVARNEGILASVGAVIVLLDCDDRAHPGLLSTFSKALADADCVAGNLSGFGGSGLRNLPRDPLAVRLGFLPSPTGACCAFTRSLYDQLDGFDETFQAGGDEVEFFWRAQIAGARLAVAPDAFIDYRLRDSSMAELRQIEGFGRSHAKLYSKFRDSGMPRSSSIDGLKYWLMFPLRGTVMLLTPRQSPRWLAMRRVLSLRKGRLLASIKYRVLYL